MDDVQHHPDREALLEIDLWVDVVCPWCWIGEERLRRALNETGLASRTRITIRAFQLDPGAQRRPVMQMLAEKFGASPDRVREMTGQVKALGAELGLHMDHEHAIACDTFDATSSSTLPARPAAMSIPRAASTGRTSLRAPISPITRCSCTSPATWASTSMLPRLRWRPVPMRAA